MICTKCGQEMEVGTGIAYGQLPENYVHAEVIIGLCVECNRIECNSIEVK